MITIAILVTTLVCIIPVTYPQEDSTDTQVFGVYGDPMSEEYGWKGYLANGGERTGYNPGPAPDIATTANRMWQSTTQFADGMVACNGLVIFCASSGNTMYALDANTGQQVWTCSLSGSPRTTFGYSTLFVVDEKHILVIGGGATMVNADTGAVLWRDTTINPAAVYHPACYSQEAQMLFGPVNSNDDDARAFFSNLTNQYVEIGWDMSNPDESRGNGGRRVWGHVMDNGGNPQLCYGDGKVYMAEYSGWGVYALDAKNGSLVWECHLQDANGYAAVYSDGVLYTHCQSVHATAINTTTGEIIWQNNEGLSRRAYAVWHGCYAYGRVYWHDLGAGLTGQTTCFDADTGEKLWGSLTVSQIGYYQICVADGKVFGQMSDGSSTTGRDPPPTQFGCWDAFTGEQLWTIMGLSCDSPTVAYGNLYLWENGRVSCYGPATAPTPGPIEPETPEEPVNWAMWRGNTENPGVAVAQHAPIMLNLGPTWTYQMEAGTSSSPAVADGKVFIGSVDYNLYCLDVEDGHQLWNFSVGRKVYSSPAYYDGKVYTGADNGNFYCLNAETGEKIWSKPDGDGSYRYFNTGLGQMQIRSSPIIYDGKVYVGGATGTFYCFDAENGDQLWSVNTGATSYIAGSAAIENDYVYFFSTNNNLYKYTLDGQQVFSRSVSNSYRSGMFVMSVPWATTPVVNGDSVYCGCATGYLVCVNSADGSPKWTNGPYFTTSEASHASLTYYENMLYAPCGPMTVGASASDGSEVWRAWGSWEIFCSTIVIPDTLTGGLYVYIGSEAGSMTCIDAATGEPMSWYTTGGNVQSTPAAYGGKLIFGSADNKVYCFEDPTYEEDTSPTLTACLSRETLHVDSQDTVTISTQLKPGIPDMDLVLSVISPEGTTTNLTSSSDIKGRADFAYTPDTEGVWSFVAIWDGIANLRGVAYPGAYSDVLTLNALVQPVPLVASVSASSTSVNPGDSVTLTASATGGDGNYTYLWYRTVEGVGVPMPSETAATLTVVLSSSGVFGYYCEIKDGAGQVHSSDTVAITVGGGAGGGISMELILAIVGIIAVAVIAIVAYIYLKKRK